MAHQYERSDVRRRQIADAALAVIAEQGLGRFTTRAIGSLVGLSDGAIFRHFRNKEEIVLAAIAALEETMSSHWNDDPDPVARLRTFFRARAAFVGKQRSVGRLLLSDHLAQAAGDAGHQEVRRWRRENRDWVLECLRAIDGADRLRKGLTPERSVRLVQGVVATFVIDGALELLGTVPLERQVDEAWATLSAALLRDPA
ncbi:TetR/AcrR family transcriptional regulator [bacterium]|nr:TetR/AcrR family transcriptional regulator [bacterium]